MFTTDVGEKSLPAVIGVATAAPPFVIRQEIADALMTQHYTGILRPRTMDVLHRVLTHPGIRTRHISVDNEEQLIGLKGEDPDRRMERFVAWAVDLSATALNGALVKADRSPADISALVVNTCTGYVCPGISTYLIERLGLSPSTRALDLVGAGCGGAIPCLQTGARMLDGPDDGVVACVSVEICSATYEMGDDISLVVSNAIFGDGAAAAVLGRGGAGTSIVSSASRFLPAYRDDVRYVHKNGHLHNKLSPQLAKVVGEIVPPFVKEFLSGQGLLVADIAHWAVHPGGDRIIDAVKGGLGLSEENLAVSRQVLEEFGNMSSPTVLFELERILGAGIAKGELCVMIGFGAGFSAHVCLLRG
jgi:predicted naringenin-chalcone synthase